MHLDSGVHARRGNARRRQPGPPFCPQTPCSEGTHANEFTCVDSFPENRENGTIKANKQIQRERHLETR